jgi:hypothetical protein
MATQLKNTLVFTDLAPGATVVLPHGLFIGTNGVLPVTPDIIFLPGPDLSVTADAINITLTNDGASELSGSVLVEYWHTIERAFGDVANEDLPVKPYIVVGAEDAGQPPQPPFPVPLTTIIIYARTTGSDVTGNGQTIPTAYRTFQRAVRDIPSITAPGVTYIVDITGIDETLPEGYTLPAWKSPNIAVFGGLPAPYSTNLFLGGPINILAIPQTVPLVPASDAVINFADVTIGDGSGTTEDLITGLRTMTLNVGRPSLAGLAGKFLLGAGFGAVIDSVDPTGTVITYADRFSPGFAGSSFPLTVSEPSAHLHSPGFVGLSAFNVDCIAFQGLKLSSDIGGFSIYTNGIGCTLMLLCELSSPIIGSICPGAVLNQTNRAAYCWITGFPQFNSELLIASCFMDATFELFGAMFITPGFPSIISTVFRDCAPVRSEAYIPQVGAFRASTTDDFLMSHCLVADGTGDGVEFYGSSGLIRFTDIHGCVGNGITVNQGSGLLKLEKVGSSAPNGGFGVQVNDGMYVRVDVETSTTLPVALTPLTGGGGDMQVGTLPAPRTWLDFRTVAPIKNEYDLTTPFELATGQPAGDELTGADTGGNSGSRLFERL